MTDQKNKKAADTTREERLKAALKANLARRKVQRRERAGPKKCSENTSDPSGQNEGKQ